MLPWLQSDTAPLYLAPMAGVTDVTFRTLCKELGADVMVTEFVSSEGIIRRDDRTRKYTEFEDGQRPVGVQLFGADGERMGEAAKKIIEWKQPDFIDINFGCPVNKVVSKNGGSSLLKDCPLLASVARGVAKAVGSVSDVPVTAKIRVGWDLQTINAPEVCKILEGEGMQAIAIHGRTRSQGYTGEANWDVIGEAASVASVPVIGNGDIRSGEDVRDRLSQTDVNGIMIGRAAMTNPWIFREAKHFLKTGDHLAPPTAEQRWEHIIRHANMAKESNRYGGELQTMRAMRSRLMSYSRGGMPAGKHLRPLFAHVESITELEDIAAQHLESLNRSAPLHSDSTASV